MRSSDIKGSQRAAEIMSPQSTPDHKACMGSTIRRPSNAFVYTCSATILAFALPLTITYLRGGLADTHLPTISSPALIGYRYPDGVFFADRHAKRNPFLYIGLHAIPACIWVTLIPFQLNQKLRKKYLTLHRISGYATFACSTILASTGWLMPRLKMAYSAPILYVHRWGPFFWPSFNLTGDIMGAFLLATLFPALYYARKKDFAKHRTWAITHSISGFVIPAQRWFMALTPGIGSIVALARKVGLANERLLTKLGLRADMSMEEIAAAELAGFALATWLAGLFIVGYYVHLKRSGKAQTRSKPAASLDQTPLTGGFPGQQ